MSRFSLRMNTTALVLSAAVWTSSAALAQDAASAPATDTAAQPQAAAPAATGTVAAAPAKKTKQRVSKQEKKDDRVVESKDTAKAAKKAKKDNPLADVDTKLPDKELYDKAMTEMQKSHFDVARLDLQTLLNTYPDSQFQMRAKLAIGDTWYREGGTAALEQAEQEYKDFITFFPNAPEAAEAQMKVANIYFREMDRPDRDYTKAVHAQDEYRNMIQEFPESPLIPEAKQKLREVQEVLATREMDIAQFYASHENYAASIARNQTVADTYPLFSHMDDVLLALGDAYAAQAHMVALMQRMPEGPKGRLEKIYTDEAAANYERLVTEYPAAAHVEDAKDRLTAMGYKIPQPTPDQLAASEALENSRAPYTLARKAKLLVMHTPDTVSAAHLGDPTMVDPAATTAPQIVHEDYADMKGVMNPNDHGMGPVPGGTGYVAANTAAPATNSDGTTTDEGTPAAAPLALQDVTTGGGSGGSDAVDTAVPMTPSDNGGAKTGNSLGVEVVPAGAGGAATGSTTYPGDKPADPNEDKELKPVGGSTATALPPVEAPADAQDTVNDVKPGAQSAIPVVAPPADGKAVKAPYDKTDDSSSKHKKKTGVDKLNPF